MVKIFFNVSSIFILNISYPIGIATLHCFACNSQIQQAKYCSGAQIQTNSSAWCIIKEEEEDKFTFFLHFQNVSSVFRDTLKGKDCFLYRRMQTLMLHYLKGLFAPFVPLKMRMGEDSVL
jgi:hypothetical protein